ncbi:hypothetical protein GCM10025873_03770 [Demequina sediminis]|nr:hypothetical protein GCM10025873_03770 [Demequina sediminis]
MSATARPEIRVAAPSHLWGVLFLRDAWRLPIAAAAPPCAPPPDFGSLDRNPSPHAESAARQAWETLSRTPTA